VADANRKSLITEFSPADLGRHSEFRKPTHIATQSNAPKTLLFISAAPDDYADLCRILRGSPWIPAAAANRHDAIDLMSRSRVSVVFCDSTLVDGTWQDVLGDMRRDDDAAPLIVTSRLADDCLWAEVLNVGGYDVLAKPFIGREVSHVLTNISLAMMQASRARVAAAG
jgi:DNA-binding response OmpR family regulator